MNFLTALNTLLLFLSPVDTSATVTEPIAFTLRVNPYGGYYTDPYSCPPGYYYGPGYGYGRGYRFYAPGYFGTYRYGCYNRWGHYYGPRYAPGYERRYYHYRHR